MKGMQLILGGIDWLVGPFTKQDQAGWLPYYISTNGIISL